MNVLLYFLSLLLVLPAVAVAAMFLVIETAVHRGLWGLFQLFLAVLDWRWILAVAIAASSLTGAAFITEARTYGFGAIAVLGAAACLVVVKVAPGAFDWGWLQVLTPAVGGVALSVFCMLKPAR